MPALVSNSFAVRKAVERVGLGLCQRDELGDRARAKRVADDKNVRDLGEQADWHELRGIIGDVAVEQGIDGERAGRAEHQGVAVGRRARDPFRADIAAAAADILDDDGLAPSLGHPVGQDPGERVERGPRRERNDHLDQPRRIPLLRDGRGRPQTDSDQRSQR
jgi:hypothetical protein